MSNVLLFDDHITKKITNESTYVRLGDADIHQPSQGGHADVLVCTH